MSYNFPTHKTGESKIEMLGRIVCFLFFAFVVSAEGQPDRSALTLNEQALAASAHSDFARAERLFGEALHIWRGLGPRYEAHTATTLANLGEMLCSAGKWREGAGALEEALELNRHSLGPKHIRTVSNLSPARSRLSEPGGPESRRGRLHGGTCDRTGTLSESRPGRPYSSGNLAAAPAAGQVRRSPRGRRRGIAGGVAGCRRN